MSGRPCRVAVRGYLPDSAMAGVPAGARVLVAMSGGVDSSVAAALLSASGFDVVGVTLQLYDHGVSVKRQGACCAGEDIKDARRVADSLGIPHYVIDAETRFRSAVMAPFAASYLNGETPVPCIACNETVKFTDLADLARDLGAAALVTGHYAERREGPEGPVLLRGKDDTRDQSYFLYRTTREQLALARFPLGGLEKRDIRKIAGEIGLKVAAKPDSQDICFVPEGRYADVVRRLSPGAGQTGEIVDETGQVLGTHGGIEGFTVGQRRGLGLAVGEPRHVIRLVPVRRQVVVGPRASLAVTAFKVRDLNWLGPGRLEDALGGTVAVRVRSTRRPVMGTLEALEPGGTLRVTLQEAEEGVAPGQAAVFYGGPEGRHVLGGGVITSRVCLRSDREG